ncbi:acetylornithine transaminase [Paenibacillus thiaminolyticus]|uniref:Acetylornithine aminotransferase n=2 Tax=Paenibacillus thiaminolyticus TaxID=49283 RepID=A0AAP9DVK0_PANTH|nr:acetylornithine transaminase [Paenibacillus thiaminolyticus]MEC0063079.1 acetylornithine transaminase [Paenibacillus thiaminolyticus]MEC0099678.1 acetylornithine transaminase [Paenibacillus thiaminolyticus]QDM44524.1 acetylornithine transaminase [Paenibacillus thiaminolyticus]SUA96127.1 acetylornithine and succinylornithine aminotransferase [Paenibacillus thiaminolyticus]
MTQADNVTSSLLPTYARYPMTLVKGSGSRLWDDRGNSYLDFMSGIAVANLGHVPERVKARVQEQLETLWHVSNLFRIPQQEQAAEWLTKHTCADAVFFCNSGAEANEAAIKLARRYHAKVAKSGRYEIITFQQSFHGRTLATLTATGQDKVKEGFHPLPEGFRYVPFNDIESLRAAVSDKTAAIMLEIVQAEGGVHTIKAAFAQEVAKLCAEHGLLLIIDEVQTGMGRTGALFAHEHYGLEPDIFTVAKGLGSGFPVGAMLAKEHLREAFGPGSHGSTFGGNPLAMSAVIGTMETMIEEKAAQRAAERGAYLLNSLKVKLSDVPVVKDVRGLGLIIGIECSEPAADIVEAARAAGLLVITAGPNVVRLLPNLLVTPEEIDEAVSILHQVLEARSLAKALV